jgi:hypothetical protein
MLWDAIKNWSEQNAARYLYVSIPPERTDTPINPAPLEPEASYFRVWLSEMYLAQSYKWFTDQFPAVQASIRMKTADNTPVTFSRVVRAPNEALARGVLMNYALTELMPFRGGTVELEAALLAFQGNSAMNYASAALGILENFGGLVAAPLGQALQVAQAVNKGIDELVSAADGRVALSLHQSFVSGQVANALRAGYIAVILATENELAPDNLSVAENKLLYGGSPLTGYDYFLLNIERRERRDDWRFSYIDQLMDKIALAYTEKNPDKAESVKGALKFAIYDSDDFTFQDKRRIMWEIKKQLDFLQDMTFDSDLDAQKLDTYRSGRQTFLPDVPATDNITDPEDLLTLF